MNYPVYHQIQNIPTPDLYLPSGGALPPGESYWITQSGANVETQSGVEIVFQS